MRRSHRRYRRHRGEHPWLPLGLLLLLCAILFPFLYPYSIQSEAAPLPSPAPEISLSPALSPVRRSMVQGACSLVGRVGYFWGGKSLSLGWDPRWGISAIVNAEGSDTTGKPVPFGLDCSGFVTWAAVNAAGTADALAVVGNGVRDQYEKCTPIGWNELQPGDLLFFPDLSHVGIALDSGDAGTIRTVHCSKSLGGVVLSADASAIGFTMAGRPALFDEATQ